MDPVKNILQKGFEGVRNCGLSSDIEDFGYEYLNDIEVAIFTPKEVSLRKFFYNL